MHDAIASLEASVLSCVSNDATCRTLQFTTLEMNWTFAWSSKERVYVKDDISFRLKNAKRRNKNTSQRACLM